MRGLGSRYSGTAVLVTPLSIPALLVIFLLYLLIQRSYRPSSVALKRLESVTRSPIYQHFGESSTGLGTLRSYEHMGAVHRALLECFHRVDRHPTFTLTALHEPSSIALPHMALAHCSPSMPSLVIDWFVCAVQ